jgi:hypothetical protein
MTLLNPSPDLAEAMITNKRKPLEAAANSHYVAGE